MELACCCLFGCLEAALAANTAADNADVRKFKLPVCGAWKLGVAEFELNWRS